jgi:hypothetical protein
MGVTATAAALEAITRLGAAHGQLPLGGAPSYIDADMYPLTERRLP